MLIFAFYDKKFKVFKIRHLGYIEEQILVDEYHSHLKLYELIKLRNVNQQLIFERYNDTENIIIIVKR
jgi:hypothetical protein